MAVSLKVINTSIQEIRNETAQNIIRSLGQYNQFRKYPVTLIKAVRAGTGLSLKEAKELVDKELARA